VNITVDPGLEVPASRQIVDAVLDGLACGAVAVGDRLPSVRELAVHAMVNPNTVAKAYRELGLRGVVQGRNGSGVFVTEEGPRIARELRRGATLDALLRAFGQAVATGHDPVALFDALREGSVPEDGERKR
jgi:GntR family transcriptional regulator